MKAAAMTVRGTLGGVLVTVIVARLAGAGRIDFAGFSGQLGERE